MTELPIADLADTLARVLHPEYNVTPLKDAILAVDKLLGQIEEARSWARHGYEIGQRSNTWSDHGVAPAWLTEGHSFGWHVLSACPDEAACAIHGRNEEPDGPAGLEDVAKQQSVVCSPGCSEAHMYDGCCQLGPTAGQECPLSPSVCEARRCTQVNPAGRDDVPELSAEDAVEAMEDMSLDLYRAEDRLAFVREMCDAADRSGEQVTTEQVRAWTRYTGCGGVLRLPDEVMPLLREFAAGEDVAAPATQASGS